MSLDITFTSRRKVVCPHCNKVVSSEIVCAEDSGGRVWYDILEMLGYYVPYDKRTEENDWYGKDMVLTTKQRTEVLRFLKNNKDIYNRNAIYGLVVGAALDNHDVVINADW